MKPADSLHQRGPTQQRLLRTLLMAPQGASVEDLCKRLGITHNAVRQHLTALMVSGLVERSASRPSGGRPQAIYILLPAGRDLFPRHYGLISGQMLRQLYARMGKPAVQSLLVEMGQELGASAAQRLREGDQDMAQALANELDALGYEAMAVKRDGETQVEAWNCVFHALAREHPDVCRFDLAFMEAATGHAIQHQECMFRGGQACRFRIGTAKPASANRKA